MAPGKRLLLTPLVVPGGTMVDGAVAELAQEPDGTITAEIRIPGPAAP